MVIFLWLFLICIAGLFHEVRSQFEYDRFEDDITFAATMLVAMSKDIIKDGKERVLTLYKVNQDAKRSVPYEVGYITMVIQENYRRMVDKFTIWTTIEKLDDPVWKFNRYNPVDRFKFYLYEIVMYLGEIEQYYWQIEHLVNMMHEIERKYKVKSAIDEEYFEPGFEPTTTVIPPHPPVPVTNHSNSETKLKMKNKVRNMLRPQLNVKDLTEEQIKKNELIANWLANYTTPKRKLELAREYGWDLEEWNSDT